MKFKTADVIGHGPDWPGSPGMFPPSISPRRAEEVDRTYEMMKAADDPSYEPDPDCAPSRIARANRIARKPVARSAGRASDTARRPRYSRRPHE